MDSNKTGKFSEGFDILAVSVVGGLFALIDLWLLLLSGFSMSYVTVREKTYFVSDSMLMHLASLGILLLLLLFIRRNCERLKAGVKKLPFCHDMGFVKAKRILLGIVFFMGLLWVFAAQLQPRADQNAVLQAAAGLHAKQYTSFSPGEYISRFPHQNGLMLFIYALGLVFGNNNYLLFQVFNVIGLVVVYKVLSELGGKMGLSKGGQLWVIAIGIFFFPLTLYVSFVYGNILGLAFALLAIQQELELFEDGKKYRIVLAAALIAIAILFKGNYLIFMVGMIICAVLECIKQKKVSFLALVVLMLVFYVGQSVAPRLLIQLKTGYDMSGGVSSWSYIAMGLQENDDRAPGWYNFYNDNTYTELHYDGKAQSAVCRDNIMQSLTQFASGERDPIRFFGEKTASQWNNPTFQCFWISQACSTNLQKSGWLRAVLGIPFTDRSSKYLGMLQFWILAGALLSLVFHAKDYRKSAFLLQMLVVGGFVFHLFWEAKGQYTLSYFVLLFPLAVMGYHSLLDVLLCRECGGSRVARRQAVQLTVMLALAVTVSVLSCLSTAVQTAVRPNRGAEDWREYVTQSTPLSFDDGEYRISPLTQPEKSIGIEESYDQKRDYIPLTKDQKVRLISYDHVFRIRFDIAARYLEIFNDSRGFTVGANDRGATQAQNQEWYITSAGEEGVYYIYNQGGTGSEVGEYALTLDNDGYVTCELLNGSDAQKWRISAQ